MFEIISDRQTFSKVPRNHPIPGLATRPKARKPSTLEADRPAAPEVSKAEGPTAYAVDPTAQSLTCNNCAPLRDTLGLALEQIRITQARVKGAIQLGHEAVERSAERVGAYHVLETIFEKHGIPFQDGKGLPKEYKDLYPRHEGEDGILLGIQRRQAMKEGMEHQNVASGSRRSEGAAEDTPSESLPFSSGDRNSNDDSDESMESIPEAFQPRNSEESEDDESFNVYDGDSESDGKWELDAYEKPPSEKGENVSEK